jgi:hypothetical protein
MSERWRAIASKRDAVAVSGDARMRRTLPVMTLPLRPAAASVSA